ncbi:Dimeric dihydrodiol dehydrogenase [Ceraceosorus bombacis]|uniref:Dimeric dihydrodiol dehydrogenase n=1 Tax=Ceraceosorus bombacis TaxID=401625 RepID=A0A0P1BN26_9BASI|nr:Dimeric dihydrodiol dehydrogenase [Ceraceosorus bombacis]
MTSAPTLPIRVGIIGAGEVSQVVHLPTLQLLPHLYKVTAITDLSLAASKHASSKFGVPQACATVDELVTLQNVDLVLIASADEYHGDHAVAAINAGKHVFIEKPLCLTRQDAERIQDAEQKAGVHVSVAYMRRYAPAFEIFKQLVAESAPVQYAVVRDLIGPNEFFVAQSGTTPIKFVEDIPAGAANDKKAKAEEQHQAFLAIPGSYQERVIRPTFVDAYTSEWTVLAEALQQSKPLKTTVADAALELDVWDMIMQKLQ